MIDYNYSYYYRVRTAITYSYVLDFNQKLRNGFNIPKDRERFKIYMNYKLQVFKFTNVNLLMYYFELLK